MPNICSENGIIPRKTHIDNHLRSVVHKECVKADKLARLRSNELQASAPIDSQFIRGNKELANYVGNYIYTVYNDAKRGTLSAVSWPSRVVASNIGSKFDINTEFTINRTIFIMLTPSVIRNFERHCIVRKGKN